MRPLLKAITDTHLCGVWFMLFLTPSLPLSLLCPTPWHCLFDLSLEPCAGLWHPWQLPTLKKVKYEGTDLSTRVNESTITLINNEQGAHSKGVRATAFKGYVLSESHTAAAPWLRIETSDQDHTHSMVQVLSVGCQWQNLCFVTYDDLER